MQWKNNKINMKEKEAIYDKSVEKMKFYILKCLTPSRSCDVLGVKNILGIFRTIDGDVMSLTC